MKPDKIKNYVSYLFYMGSTCGDCIFSIRSYGNIFVCGHETDKEISLTQEKCENFVKKTRL